MPSNFEFEIDLKRENLASIPLMRLPSGAGDEIRTHDPHLGKRSNIIYLTDFK